jgi:WXG100 family type VII secretion target
MLRVDFAVLDTLHQDLRAIETAASEAIQTLETELNGSLSQWSGAARELYMQRRAEWTQAFARMDSILAAAKDHVLNTNQLYQETEQNNMRMWAK